MWRHPTCSSVSAAACGPRCRTKHMMSEAVRPCRCCAACAAAARPGRNTEKGTPLRWGPAGQRPNESFRGVTRRRLQDSWHVFLTCPHDARIGRCAPSMSCLGLKPQSCHARCCQASCRQTAVAAASGGHPPLKMGLRVEEELNVPHALRRRPCQVGVCQLLKVARRAQHAHPRKVDGQEVLLHADRQNRRGRQGSLGGWHSALGSQHAIWAALVRSSAARCHAGGHGKYTSAAAARPSHQGRCSLPEQRRQQRY